MTEVSPEYAPAYLCHDCYMLNIMYMTNTGWYGVNWLSLCRSLSITLECPSCSPSLWLLPLPTLCHTPSHHRVSGVDNHQSFLPPPPPSHSPNRRNSAPYQYDQVTAIHVLIASSTHCHAHFQVFNVVSEVTWLLSGIYSCFCITVMWRPAVKGKNRKGRFKKLTFYVYLGDQYYSWSRIQ